MNRDLSSKNNNLKTEDLQMEDLKTDDSKTHKFDETKAQTLEPNMPIPEITRVHFRCPKCMKLFSAKTDHIYVEKPEFTCNSCHTDFWVSFDDALSTSEVVGNVIKREPIQAEELFLEAIHQKQIMETTTAAQKFENAKFEEETNEQKSSLLEDIKSIIDEVDDAQMEFIENNKKERDPEVSDFWSRVLNDYSDLSLHDEFINFCHEKDNIGYAAEKYQSMLETNQHDQIAHTYINKISHAAVMSAENQIRAEKETREERSFIGAWLGGFIGFSLLLVVLGFTFEPLKNLVSLGVALIFFTFALQALLHKGE